MNICFATDDNYVDLLLVAIQSIINTKKETDIINMYILHQGISDENISRILSIQDVHISYIFIDLKEKLLELQRLKINSLRGSFCSYARLFLPDILPKTVDRILYLDCDICVMDSLSYIWNFDMKNKPVGMVIDTMLGWHRKKIGLYNNSLYYNAGVLLMDVQLCRKIGFLDLILNHIKNVRSTYPCHDQDLLNVVFEGNIVTLPPECNMLTYCLFWGAKNITDYIRLNQKLYYSEEEISHAKKNPIIYHLVSSGFVGRPWEIGNIHPANTTWNNNYQAVSSIAKMNFKKISLSSYQKFVRILFRLLNKDLFCKLFYYWHYRYEKKDLRRIEKHEQRK